MTQLPEITETYVKSLADPLIRHTTEPIDTMSVLAIAVQAALYEAWEHIERGETHLRMFDKPAGGPGTDAGIWMTHGEIVAGKRVIRRIAEVLRLMKDAQPTVPTEADVRAAMAQLDGSVRSAVSLLTGMTPEQLDELRGTDA